MALPMTEDEIRTSYRDAKKPKAQIKILAELNNTSEEAIQQIITGVKPTSPERKKYNRIDDYEALDMHRQGATEKQIADYFGVTKEAVRSWKKRRLTTDEINKQEEPIMPEVNDTPVQLDTQEAQQEEQDTLVIPDNVLTLTKEEHAALHDIDDLDDLNKWIETHTATVGQRIDIILSQLLPSDGETVRKTFGLLCGRIISEHIGL
ncbi:MAG: helix-turn-helix domain-containing protein [Eubacteriales bacterium]